MRFAPYALAVAVITLAVSWFWVRPPITYLPIAAFSGALVFVFHFLRWRSGREIFQIAAMAVGLMPALLLSSRLRGLEMVQYLAIFTLSYTLSVVIFRQKIVRFIERRHPAT